MPNTGSKSDVDVTSTGTKASWNRTLAERLFGHQYAKEMRLPSGQRSTEWAARLPSVVAGMNGEVTRLTGKKPSDAIKAKTVAQKPSSVVPGGPNGLQEQRLPSGVGVCYLYQPGELEGGRRRGTDPVWSLTVHRLGRPTLSFRRMGFSSAEHRCTHPSQPRQPEGHLESKGESETLIQVLPVDAMAVGSQDIHAMAEGLLLEESLFILLLSCVLFQDIRFHPLCLLDVSPASLKD